MRRSSFSHALLGVAIVASHAVAQQAAASPKAISPAPTQTATPAPPAQTPHPSVTLPFERQMRKTVSFIELVCQDGDKLVKVQGTGFFIIIPEKRISDSAGFAYLVTNRHVAMCWDDHLNPMSVRSLSIRLNLRDGSSKVLTQLGNLPWILSRR
jgi:hypothetical protein